MLDANHGDSNVIDMCVEDLQNGRYVGKSWRRFLIDVGPDVNAVNRNVIRVIVAYKFPIGPGGDQPLGDDVEPKIQMVQFTHTDEDHSGGGS
ncbi:hypothetical protein P167DRAFT_540182 [Morchella conica CCBAS932]|uniref:Uncharacterized protein n=1 Tax=Morchella conica CCBAS932 TaxID=1392247 RepID=A0A3N4KA40_9PEZI|nr:hypothetical protein P167DRAFT_540182 [Morchella conica CCBAS932]